MIRRLLTVSVVSGGVAVAAPSGVASADNGNLWLYGTVATGDTGQPVLGATGPAITGLTTGGYETAWQPAAATGKPALNIKVLIRWRWSHGDSRIVKLLVGRHLKDMTLRMRCVGRGCPETERSAHAR